MERRREQGDDDGEEQSWSEQPQGARKEEPQILRKSAEGGLLV